MNHLLLSTSELLMNELHLNLFWFAVFTSKAPSLGKDIPYVNLVNYVEKTPQKPVPENFTLFRLTGEERDPSRHILKEEGGMEAFIILIERRFMNYPLNSQIFQDQVQVSLITIMTLSGKRKVIGHVSTFFLCWCSSIMSNSNFFSSFLYKSSIFFKAWQAWPK